MDELSVYLTELTCGDEQRAERAAAALAGYGERALVSLSNLLASAEAEVRWWTVRALAEIQGEPTTKLLVQALQDPEISVRQCAAQALHRQPDPEAISALLEAMRSQDGLLRRLAGNALIATGASATPQLLEILSSGSQPERLEAARALALIADPRAIPSLYQALDNESALLEYWASEGLEKMGVGMVFFKP